MQVWNVLHAACWKYKTQKIATIARLCLIHVRSFCGCSAVVLHIRLHNKYIQYISSQLKHVSTTGKKVVKQQYLFHMSSQYGELWPTNGWDCWRVWGTPANFNGFRVLALLLHRRRSTEVNQTLHDVWLSPGLVHYIYIFGGSYPTEEFCQVHNSLCVQVLRSPILAALLHALEQYASAKLCGVEKQQEKLLRTARRFFHFSTPVFSRAAMTWYFRTVSSSLIHRKHYTTVQQSHR